jgi:pimeloyl-ACP methyl ester carboxylesterase
MQPWPALAPYARKVQTHSGLTLFAFEAGVRDAPPLVLIHGLGDEADTWRHVIAPLAERFHVVAPDLPGFGRSDKPDRAYSLAFLRDTIVELMDALGWQTAGLMGHSLGAAIAQTVALEHPARVRDLTLVSGSLTARAQKLNPVILQMALPFLGERMYNSLRASPDAAFATLRPYYANFDTLPEAERQFLYQRVNERVWSDGQRRAFLSILRQLIFVQAGQQKKLEARLAQLATPTRAVWGEADAVNSVESGRALAAVQKGATLTVLPGVGHNVQQEAPEELVRDVLR